MVSAVSKPSSSHSPAMARRIQPKATEKSQLNAAEIAGRTGLARIEPGVASNLKRQVAPTADTRRPTLLTSKGIGSKRPPDAMPRTRTGWGPGDLIDDIRERIDQIAEGVHDARAAMKGAEEFRRASTDERWRRLAEARAAFNADPDDHTMDSVDLFRDRLDPAARVEYDRQLDQLRDDPRVRVVNHDGSAADPATRELALRGTLAATFPSAERLEDAIQTAVDTKFENGHIAADGEGTFDIIVYPEGFEIAPHTYPGSEGEAVGLKTQENDVVISEAFLDHALVAGESLMVHEFAHCLQSASSNGGVGQWRNYPSDFDYGKEVDQAFASDPEFREYIRERFGVVHDGAERFPTVLNLFKSEPEALREASPEIYDMMVAYSGLDPISGEITSASP